MIIANLPAPPAYEAYLADYKLVVKRYGHDWVASVIWQGQKVCIDSHTPSNPEGAKRLVARWLAYRWPTWEGAVWPRLGLSEEQIHNQLTWQAM